MSGLPNPQRGESVLHIDGRPAILCLTLGALARLEAAFGVASLGELEARLRDLSGQDLVTLVAALLVPDRSRRTQGSGQNAGAPWTLDTLTHARIDPVEAVNAVIAAFERAQS